MRLSPERPSRKWTDDDKQFPERIRIMGQRIANGIDLRGYCMFCDTDNCAHARPDPLDVIAAQLWLDWTFPVK